MTSPTVTVLDVGHGSCTVITDGEHATLIDTGPGAPVLEYLLQEHIEVIDVVVLSHADEDHIRGLIALLGADQFTIHRIMLNSDAAKASESWRNLAYEIDELHRSGSITLEVQLREGDIIDTRIPEVDLHVLAPRDRLIISGPGSKDRDGRRITSNSISAVILICYRGVRLALVTGDLDDVGLSHAIEASADLSAQVLVFPHHGGLAGGSAAAAAGFAQQLVAKVDPESIAISLGRGKYANPRPEIIAGMRAGAPNARIACTQLSKFCAVNLPLDRPSHLLPLFARGSTNNACCAGTMRIVLPQGNEVLPSDDAHGAFIGAVAPSTALCRR